jgi:hypothetical protein
MEEKLDVGGTLSKALAAYGAYARVLLPAAFGVFLVAAVINGLADGLLLLLVAVTLRVVATTLYQGMVVGLVAEKQEGQPSPSVGELVSSVAPVAGSLIVAGVLIGIGLMFGLVLLVVPALFLSTIWSVVAPVIVVERRSAMAALARSRELVRGHGWQTFGVILSVLLIQIAVWIVLARVAAAIHEGAALRIAVDVIGATVTAPLSALVVAVLYFRLSALEESTALLHADED